MFVFRSLRSISPDGRTIVSSDDSGSVCVWGQSKAIIRYTFTNYHEVRLTIFTRSDISLCRLIKRHEEAVYCLAFAPDSSILMTACSIGNIRISYMDNETDGMIFVRCDQRTKLFHKFHLLFFAYIYLEPDCWIDAAHDMGVLSTDFCKLYHTDRLYSISFSQCYELKLKLIHFDFQWQRPILIQPSIRPLRVEQIKRLNCGEFMHCETSKRPDHQDWCQMEYRYRTNSSKIFEFPPKKKISYLHRSISAVML